jgi:hypothetical protein
LRQERPVGGEREPTDLIRSFWLIAASLEKQ